MILGIVVLLLVGGVTYWHYAQGFFSATFSAISAVLAAVLAVSYHEVLVKSLLRGAMADYANAMMLAALFALLYIILRTIFDNMVPGNIRLPLYVDRVGGAVMGLIAALFTAGIFALSAQAMPFGPAVGGYARYALDDNRELQVMPGGGNRKIDVQVEDQLKEDHFDPATKKSLLIPADDVVLAAVQRLSDGGSLAGDQPLSAVHPNYADELFAQRLGVQIGAKRTAVNLPGTKEQVTVPSPGVFFFDKDVLKNQIDAELETIHQRAVVAKPTKPADFPLVVRVMFEHNASDTDNKVRVSPASVRLVANNQNYWPIGTVEHGNMIYVNKIDDFLIIDSAGKDRGADFIFFVDPSDVLTGGEKDKDRKVKDGVFLEVKRLAQIDLGGQELQPRVKPSPDVEVIRKPEVKERDKKGPAKGAPGGAAAAPGGATAAADPSAGPVVVGTVSVSDKLFTPINVGSGEANLVNAQLKSGTCSTKDKKFTKLNIEPVDSIRLLSEGTFAIDTFFVTPGQKMVQVGATPPAEGGDAWAWANNMAKFAMSDANGKNYKPSGGWAKVKQQNADRLVASYNYAGGIPAIKQSEGRPTDCWIAFLVPSGTQLKQLIYDGKPISDVNTTAE
jgi:hypothetical protein